VLLPFPFWLDTNADVDVKIDDIYGRAAVS
jgi:hypothetical protein